MSSQTVNLAAISASFDVRVAAPQTLTNEQIDAELNRLVELGMAKDRFEPTEENELRRLALRREARRRIHIMAKPEQREQ